MAAHSTEKVSNTNLAALMSDFLKLTKSGLKAYENNPDRRGDYRWKKAEKPTLQKKSDGSIISFEDERSREFFFYDEFPVETVWTDLGTAIYIDDNVTLGDLMRVIEQYPELQLIVQLLFPVYPMIAGGDSDKDFAEVCVVTSSGEIKDNKLTVQDNIGFTNSRNWASSTLLQIDESFPIYKDDEEIVRCCRILTLLDLLKSLYQFSSPEPVAFLKDGLFDEQGSLIEEPIKYLLSPIAIEEDCTIGDLASFVRSNETLKDFIACYSSNQIDEIHKQLDDAPNPKPNLWHIEVYHKFKGAPRSDYHFSTEADCRAIGDLSCEENSHYDAHPEIVRPNNSVYGLGMTRLNEVKDLPIVLKQEAQFFLYDEKLSIRSSEAVQTEFTLLDVLNAFYSEISYYGSPEEAEEVRREFEKRLEFYEDMDVTDQELLSEAQVPDGVSG